MPAIWPCKSRVLRIGDVYGVWCMVYGIMSECHLLELDCVMHARMEEEAGKIK